MVQKLITEFEPLLLEWASSIKKLICWGLWGMPLQQIPNTPHFLGHRKYIGPGWDRWDNGNALVVHSRNYNAHFLCDYMVHSVTTAAQKLQLYSLPPYFDKLTFH